MGLCENETADVNPYPLQNEQEGQQVEHHCDNLERGGGMEEGVEGKGGRNRFMEREWCEEVWRERI